MRLLYFGAKTLRDDNICAGGRFVNPRSNVHRPKFVTLPGGALTFARPLGRDAAAKFTYEMYNACVVKPIGHRVPNRLM